MIQVGVAIGLESGIVKLYDLYANKLMEIVVGKDIVQISSSPNQDDMFISVLTKDNKFFIYDLALERKFNIKRDKFSEAQNNSNEALE